MPQPPLLSRRDLEPDRRSRGFRTGSRGIARFRVRRRRLSTFLEPPHHAFAKQRFRFAEESCVHVREDTVKIASNPKGHECRQTRTSGGSLDAKPLLQTIRDRSADPEAAVLPLSDV